MLEVKREKKENESERRKLVIRDGMGIEEIYGKKWKRQEKKRKCNKGMGI